MTWCDFDHVVMILKFETDPSEVYFVEALSDGVKLNKWANIRDLIGSNKWY